MSVKLYFEEIPAISDDDDEKEDASGGVRIVETFDNLNDEAAPPPTPTPGGATTTTTTTTDGENGRKKRSKKKKKGRKGGQSGSSESSSWKCGASTASGGPSPRGGCSLVVSQTGMIIAMGGANRQQQEFATVHTFDPASSRWTTVEESSGGDEQAPGARSGHSAVVFGASMFVFGGCSLANEAFYNDVRSLDTESFVWTHCAVEGDIPARWEHGAARVGSSLLVFGGADGEGTMSDVRVLSLADPKNMAWTELVCAEPRPCAREMVACCAREGRTDGETGAFYVTGGRRSDGTVMGDFWLLDPATANWTKLRDMPSPRCSHSAVIVKSSLCVYGGWDGAMTIYGDLQLFDFRSQAWSNVELNPSPPERFGHGVCTVADGFYAFGGMNVQTDIDELLVLQHPESSPEEKRK